MSIPSRKNVVLLVDNRQRDLLVATLIAYQLEQLGVTCHLEPLEAYQGVLATYRPEMIIFNHLLARHLVNYSQRLHDLGVLTAVLPNEGIAYNEGDLHFLAGNHHSDAHIDFFFCWNELHRQALCDAGFTAATRIEVVGVPRFDLYFPPWTGAFQRRARCKPERPLLVLCTNFVFAHYRELAPETVDRFFAPWKDRIPDYRDYWKLVDIHQRSQARLLDFLNALVAADAFELILRPHPSENVRRYQAWFEQLAPGQREAVIIDRESSIVELILACDLELSCETCTTALESWIAGKPTVELSFERHPLFAKPDAEGLTVICGDPAQVVEVVRRELAGPTQPAFREARATHLAKWCALPTGNSSARMAQIIAETLAQKTPPDWSRLGIADLRRGVKLRLLHRVGLPYHFDPLLAAKGWLFADRYGLKTFTYQKSIKPRDVQAARARLAECLEAAADGVLPLVEN